MDPQRRPLQNHDTPDLSSRRYRDLLHEGDENDTLTWRESTTNAPKIPLWLVYQALTNQASCAWHPLCFKITLRPISHLWGRRLGRPRICICRGIHINPALRCFIPNSFANNRHVDHFNR